jgi:hypothetical protein
MSDTPNGGDDVQSSPERTRPAQAPESDTYQQLAVQAWSVLENIIASPAPNAVQSAQGRSEFGSSAEVHNADGREVHIDGTKQTIFLDDAGPWAGPNANTIRIVQMPTEGQQPQTPRAGTFQMLPADITRYGFEARPLPNGGMSYFSDSLGMTLTVDSHFGLTQISSYSRGGTNTWRRQLEL